MNRHHPYGGNFDGHRRGGSPSGPGPDRSHRFQERSGGYRGRSGYGRGRGGGRGGVGDYSPYDGGMHGGYSNDMEAYNEYDSQAPHQDSYYQDVGSYSSYNQGFGKYEDDTTNGYDDDAGGYSRGPRRPPMRKDRDDKVHDSIIEERIQRERPCRTLFIRNIKYETNSDDVRRQFEEFGSIKTFFDLISTRGMVFVTYYDLRAAERARDRLQGSEISGRPIDVHYSLPRDDQKGPERERNQQFQGTLQVTLRASPSGQLIDDTEVRRKFQAFGDIKSVRPANDRVDSRYVEFYDIRNCEDAFNALRHQGLQDGVMDIVYAWDYTEGQLEGRANGGRRDWEGIDIHRGRGGGGSRGRGRGRGRGGHSGGHQINEWEDRREYGRDRDPRRGRYENEHSGRGGRGGGYGDKFDNRNGGYGGGSGGGNSAGYNSTPPSFAPSSTGQPSAISGDDRLEQARKVQQLLAALKQPQPGAASVAPPSHVVTPPISPSVQASASIPPFAPYPPTSTLQQPSYASSLPPSNSYAGASPNASMNVAGLPPNVLALLQGAQQRQPTPPQYGGPSLPLPGPPGVPHQSVSQFQQLMSYLQTQGKQ